MNIINCRRKYHSTVFLCDVSPDGRYIRCDFNKCSEHAQPGQEPSWILNTVKNVRHLEQHVGSSIESFMLQNESVEDRSLFETNIDLISNPVQLHMLKKILVVLNLRDHQSQLGVWMSEFVKAALKRDGLCLDDTKVLTLSFASRAELLDVIGKLCVIPLNAPNAQVLVVLSCHSSSQGQVFSCTPTKISQEYKFEEFCSLHDFVQSCQDALQGTLHGIHVSSCFALRLDASHVEWPVDYTWISKHLHIPLSGSEREVYETGSQVADLYLLLSVFCTDDNSLNTVKMKLRKALDIATVEDFPDLSTEMGLLCIDGQNVDSMVTRPCFEDKVTPPTKVSSTVHMVLLHLTDNEETDSHIESFKDAIIANLTMRNRSDIQFHFSDISLQKTCTRDEILNKLSMLEVEGRSLFFVFLGKPSGYFCDHFVACVNNWKIQSNILIYGMHFHSVNPELAFRLGKTLGTPQSEDGEGVDYAVTGCLEEVSTKASISFPLLLYIIHLSLGENGLRRYWTQTGPARKLLPSEWTLEDVYSETSYVLSGLSRKCALVLLHKSSGGARDVTSTNYGRVSSDTNPGDRPVNSVTESSSVASSDTSECRLETIENSGKVTAGDLMLTKEEGQENNTGLKNLAEEDRGSQNTTRINPFSSTHSRNSTSMVTNEALDVADSSPFPDTRQLPNISDQELTLPDSNSKRTQVFSKDTTRTDDGKGGEVSSLGESSSRLGESNSRLGESSSSLVESNSTSIDERSSQSADNIVARGDLPLMANVDEVLVSHYILDLTVDFDIKVVRGSIILFLTTVKNVDGKKFQMCLDSSLTTVESVEEISLPDDFQICFHGQKCCCEPTTSLESSTSSACKNCSFIKSLRTSAPPKQDLEFKFLKYSVGGWCIRVWKSGQGAFQWPKCVRISYTTSPEGPSLEWTRDQDGRPCVFTPGAYINNRSFMPCQEPPVAMSTWQALIKVPKGCKVLMSGNTVDCSPVFCDSNHPYTEFYYEMPIPLPCTTLALAIGYFATRGIQDVLTPHREELVKISFHASPSMIEKLTTEFAEQVPLFLVTACEILGEYPFSRLDLILMPANFACMGLKSPNLAFLSQSLLCGDQSMAVRLAHEISHAWFGLLIGAKDWTEEWLSEGFATYMEDRIQAKALKWSESETENRCDLRRMLRYRTLKGEIQEAADDNMKQLRPERVGGNYLSAVEAVNISMKDGNQGSNPSDKIKPHTVVKWGAIPSRKWTQVHYIKGYFLLHCMSTLVGVSKFDEFLNHYVQTYGGSLVTSEMFFDLYIKTFDLVSQIKEKLVKEWLENPGIPQAVEFFKPAKSNKLVTQVEDEYQWWKNNDSANKRCKSRGVKRRKTTDERPLLHPEQVVLLLEKLLERDTIAVKTMSQLQSVFIFEKQNAEVRHRWCELVIKHKYSRGYADVGRFLRGDQGMGIYLFGELMISENPTLQRLARNVFAEIGDNMDRCTHQTVYEMLNGI